MTGPLPQAPARSIPAGFPLLRNDLGEMGEGDEVSLREFYAKVTDVPENFRRNRQGCFNDIHNRRSCQSRPLSYPTHFLAFLNIRIHGPSSPQPSGCHECCTARNTRSGCGIMMVKRPSGVVRPVMPWAEPLELDG